MRLPIHCAEETGKTFLRTGKMNDYERMVLLSKAVHILEGKEKVSVSKARELVVRVLCDMEAEYIDEIIARSEQKCGRHPGVRP